MKEIYESYVYKGDSPLKETDKYFEFWNINPKGQTGYDDQPFQILKAFRPDLSSKEVMALIIDDLITHGLAVPDSYTVSRLIRKNLNLKENKTHEKLEEFMKQNQDNQWMIIRMGNRIELYNKKIYGHLPFNLETRVEGYFIPEVEPCLK